MALPRIHRLVLSQQKVRTLRKTGKKIHTSFLTAFLNTGNEARFAIVVGTNISKKATVRNKVRRQIQQEIMLSLPKDMKVDMMIYPKSTIVGKPAAEIKKEISSLFQKIA